MRPTVCPEKAICRVLGIFTSKALLGHAVWVQGTPTPCPVSSSPQAGALLAPLYRCVLSPLHSTPLNLEHSTKLGLPAVILAYR